MNIIGTVLGFLVIIIMRKLYWWLKKRCPYCGNRLKINGRYQVSTVKRKGYVQCQDCKNNVKQRWY